MEKREREGCTVVGAACPEESLRILVAEDSLVNQKVMALFLERDGHRVCLVDNGADAVAALEREQFDLVLMDVQMPVMDGFEATRAIRSLEGATGERLPIIALTAHTVEGDRERCLAAGMDDYLPKPFQIGTFREMIARFLAG